VFAPRLPTDRAIAVVYDGGTAFMAVPGQRVVGPAIAHVLAGVTTPRRTATFPIRWGLSRGVIAVPIFG